MRKKTKKMRGKKTHGYGSRKKHRGKGSRGGKGMAGSGKRADTKKTLILNVYGKEYYGKHGFTSLRKKGRAINIDQLSEGLPSLMEKGYASKSAEAIQVDLEKAGYTKLLGRGILKEKYLIKVKTSSEQARKKVEELGGKIILLENVREKKSQSIGKNNLLKKG